MRRFKSFKVASLLLAFGAQALAPSIMHANDHDGSTPDLSTGLSEASRYGNRSAYAAGPIETFSGQLHTLYGDAPSGSGIPSVTGYVLVDKNAQAVELLFNKQVSSSIGSPLSLNQKDVTITGQMTVAPLADGTAHTPLLTVRSLTHNVAAPKADAAAAANVSPASFGVSGPQPWATLLCRFGDTPSVTTHPVEWFQTLILGTTAPGLEHFWRELSYNNVNLAGSGVYGWYNLPHPRSYYVSGNPLALDHLKAATDCTAAANADVNFPPFVGINLIFNGDLDGYAWGGSMTLTLDGAPKNYRITWLPPWGYENQGVVGHEMGHGFGLPHSSGDYQATYDSRWDVMSDIWDNCQQTWDPIYGCVGPHTISYHKDILGWIPSVQKYTATPNTEKTIILERLGQPTSSSNYLMAQIPINGSTTQFYTVEARSFAGYDTKLPGEAVIIHRVNTALWDRDAEVVDPDRNGNPNDASAMWVTSETFIDQTNGITVAVLSSTATSFQVKITLGDPNPPQPDLVITSLSNPPATVLVGTSLTISDTVANQGTGSSGASTTRYRFSTDNIITRSDYLLPGFKRIPALAAGTSSGSAVTFTVPVNTPPGIYYLGACADDLDQVAEKSETNNCKVSTTTIQVTVPSLKPDLVISSLISQTTVVRGSSFRVTDTTTNTGAAPTSKETYNSFAFSSSATITSSDKVRLYRAVPILGVGQSSSMSVMISVPIDLPVGKYYVGACADQKSLESESIENNNCKVSSTQIEVTANPLKPDLFVSTFSSSVNSAKPGVSFTVNDITENRLGVLASGVTYTRYYISKSPIVTNLSAVGLTLLDGKKWIPALSGGNRVGGSATVKVPATTLPGTYYIGACADDFHASTESDETNNCLTSSVQFEVLPQATKPKGTKH